VYFSRRVLHNISGIALVQANAVCMQNVYNGNGVCYGSYFHGLLRMQLLAKACNAKEEAND
jgi:hypothetical protein